MGTTRSRRIHRSAGAVAIVLALIMAAIPAARTEAAAPGPILVMTEPADGLLTRNDAIRIAGHVSDDAGIESVTVNERRAAVDPDGSFRINVLLSEGVNEFTVTARNTAGAETATTVTVIADWTAPTLTHMLPAGDVTVAAGETLTVMFRSEPGLTAAFQVALAGTPGTSTGVGLPTGTPMTEVAPGLYRGSWTAPAAQLNGALIRFGAADAVHNLTYTTAPGRLRVVSDHDPDYTPPAPALTVTDPADGLITNETMITVSGIANDAAGLEAVTVNGTAADVSPSGQFTASVSLDEGVNTIHLVARNILGVETAATLTVTRDTAGPVITWATPEDGATTTEPTVVIEGSVSSPHGIALLSVNGLPASIGGDGSFAETVSLTPGTNTLTVTATDGLGNVTDATRTVHYVPLQAAWDPIAPRNARATVPVKLRLSDASGNSVTAAEVDLIIWAADGSFAATYTMRKAGNHYHANVNGLERGTYRLEAVVTLDGVSVTVAGPHFELR